MTTWTQKEEYQIDLGHLLTDLSDIITNENDEEILFHNGELYNGTTNWYTRNN